MAPTATETILEQYPTSILKNTSVQENGVIENQKSLVANTLKDRILSIDTATCEPGEEDAFFVADMGEVYRQHLRWKMNLKRVKPHYGKSW
jgi:ornithine decarboxylase